MSCAQAKQVCSPNPPSAILDPQAGLGWQGACGYSEACDTLARHSDPLASSLRREACEDYVTLCAYGFANSSIFEATAKMFEAPATAGSERGLAGSTFTALQIAQALSEDRVGGYLWRKADGSRDIFIPPALAAQAGPLMGYVCMAVDACVDGGVLSPTVSASLQRLGDLATPIGEWATMSPAEWRKRPELAAMTRYSARTNDH